MADSQKRIAGAFLIGACIVASAFFISRNSIKNQTLENTAAIATIERSYIDVGDSDNDGIPDWQDALMKNKSITIPHATSTYEEPKTVTGKFAVTFFEDFIRSKSSGVFGDSSEELASKSTSKLIKQAQDELFNEKDIVLFAFSDTDSLKAYGNHVASILISHPQSGDAELAIFESYMRYKDPERLKDLEPIAFAYTTMVKELLEAPVPETRVKQHLDLLNALNAVREDIRAMQKVDTDALYTLLRMKRYEDDVLGLSNALKNLFNTLYLEDNVRWVPGEPVLQLMTFTE